ncbi:uncharacterized protein LOC124198014 [Daphnia pulex]|uniref:uncharacterized protein LOC124198014 n=1 Tax=Daphnia pulex TaxID=6669 RepID=UPI001EE00740|nr:uncharacterized protein LOC124198014 [Daphnia pulex]
MVIYGVVLLLGVVSLVATGVAMSPGYGRCQTTTPPPYYTTTTYATTSYYTEAPQYYTNKAQEYYTTTYAAPSYYTEVQKHYSSPSFNTKELEYYTVIPSTTPPRHRSTVNYIS